MNGEKVRALKEISAHSEEGVGSRDGDVREGKRESCAQVSFKAFSPGCESFFNVRPAL